MLIKIHPETPSHRQILRVVEILEKGGIVIYPTDTIYGMGCDIKQSKATEKIASFKGVNPKNPSFSFIFHDLSQLSEYTAPISNNIFKMMKRNLPGPFTFILQANSQVPKLFKKQKKTIGVRIPDNNIIREIVYELGRPILTTSIHDPDEILEYTTDPELIYEKYGNFSNAVIDGGFGNNIPSTIVDCTGDEPVITRQGIGELLY
ncbi:MAG: L-threonylcarbamoyladenylate synthase [Bacteroidales bacterium]|nr:L-threonylcarbamoyladenylate synthase [Bacteroidales bacterium]